MDEVSLTKAASGHQRSTLAWLARVCCRHSLVSTSVTTMGLENWILKPQGYSPVPLLIFTVLSRTAEKGNSDEQTAR